MPNQVATLDQVFHSLANPTRREVLSSLSRGPATVSDLAKPFDMALPSFLQHLDLLEDRGLVSSSKTGRVRTFELKPMQLGEAEDWLSAQRTLWTRRLDQLDRFLISLKDQKP